MASTSNEHTVSIPLQQQSPPLKQQSPSPVRPCNDLINGSREVYMEVGIPLYEASIKGNWKLAKSILDKQPELVRFSITRNYETPLHVAASVKDTKQAEEFVRNLMGKMTNEDLLLQNKDSNTALSLAAAAGNVTITKTMVSRNKALLDIPGSGGTPLYVAALFAHSAMVNYLYDNSEKMTGDSWNNENRGWVLLQCIEANLFDVALRIVNDRSELAEREDLYYEILLSLARKTDAFYEIKPKVISRIMDSICNVRVEPAEKDGDALQLLKIIWKNVAKLPTNRIDNIIRGPCDEQKDIKPKDIEFETKALNLLENISRNTELTSLNVTNPKPKQTTSEKEEETQKKERKYSSRVLFVAAEMGNTRFLVELIRRYPEIIWKVNDNNESIFHIAVSCRHEGIYNLLYEMGSMKDLITPLQDRNDNNMLHLVGKSANKKRLQDVSGVALQMQRELLWFKEVKSMVPPAYRENRNKDGLAPHELFTKEHKDLVARGEQWMKDTAAQCMLVATLIATIVFAAAFTVPGGYNQDKGFPIFFQKVTFIVFVISDSISLFLSSSSILMFLSILTSRYAENDFLESLPKKLIKGLVLLFLSISTMVVAFSMSFFVLYHNKLIWIPIFIGVCAAIPVILFAILQYSLLKDMIQSTYRSNKFLFKPKKPVLYY